MKKIFAWSGILLLPVFLLLQPFLIKVRVECKSQFGICPEEVVSKINNIKSKSLWQVKSAISKTLKNDPMVSDFSTQFKLPNILLLNLLIKTPFFAIKDRTTSKLYLTSRDGSILTEAQSTQLPIIEQDGIVPNLFALNLILGVYQMYQVGYGTITNDTLTVDMPGPLRVIFPLEGDREVLLGSLRLVYSKIEGSGNPNKYSQIDLRFVSPVLR